MSLGAKVREPVRFLQMCSARPWLSQCYQGVDLQTTSSHQPQRSKGMFRYAPCLHLPCRVCTIHGPGAGTCCPVNEWMLSSQGYILKSLQPSPALHQHVALNYKVRMDPESLDHPAPTDKRKNKIIDRAVPWDIAKLLLSVYKPPSTWAFLSRQGFSLQKGCKNGFEDKSIAHNSKCSELVFIAMGKQLASPKGKT